jgi:hypothetical protein
MASESLNYTKEEQSDLNNLSSNLEVFELLQSLLVQGRFYGSQAHAVVRCQQLADNLIKNTKDLIEKIQKDAESRSAQGEQNGQKN